MPSDDSISLNKYISSTGRCSRREADKLIEQGRVLLNGVKARKGNRVSPGDEVIVDGGYVERKKNNLLIAYNKPVGIVCTTDQKEPNNIVSQIKHKERLFPIGRLDKASQGLIFLTNDGDIVNKILRAGNEHEKEYIVTVNKPIDTDFIRRMSGGLPILGTKTKKCKVSAINDNTFRIILTQGLNRQIRRMCEFLGYKVASLKRIRIMNVKLGNLPIGKWRALNSSEIQKIRQLLSHSSKTA
ncbi:23S rRNA pseudouridine(2604) synthase RluF [Portibacter marinus]|uniref:23S rRNA pseudouridine(2604) synthase RluF n=1 Tax=Portibacter marinus TaxID=2898660 RepID=UPI001F164954|nr:23S rRNA pseudouridine(2604) synthase RluF [Portibacter marinus]